MNQSATALALLEENARQCPQSSGAAFGLGRAFRTAGDDAKARAEFQARSQEQAGAGCAQASIATAGKVELTSLI